jgi:hypothetical protein
MVTEPGNPRGNEADARTDPSTGRELRSRSAGPDRCTRRSGDSTPTPLVGAGEERGPFSASRDPRSRPVEFIGKQHDDENSCGNSRNPVDGGGGSSGARIHIRVRARIRARTEAERKSDRHAWADRVLERLGYRFRLARLQQGVPRHQWTDDLEDDDGREDDSRDRSGIFGER